MESSDFGIFDRFSGRILGDMSLCFLIFLLASAPGPLDVRQILIRFDKVEGLKCGKI